MAETSGAGNVEVGFSADPGDLARLGTLIENAISSGFEKGMKSFSKFSQQLASQTAEAKKLQATIAKTFNAKTFDQATEGLDRHQKATGQLIKAYIEMGARIQTVEKQIYQDTIRQQDQQRQFAISLKGATAQQTVDLQIEKAKQLATTKANIAESLQSQRAALDSEGRAQRESIDLNLNAAKTASKLRVEFTRAAIQQIVALEKTLATVIGELFHGTLSVAGTVATGIKDVFVKGFSSVASVFKKSDEAINLGMGESLSKRELQVRSSFEKQTEIISSNTLRQTEIVRAGATKQAAALEELKVASSTGLAGSAKNVALGAGFLGGGIAIFQAFKSTFGVGSEFIRGLAVVQAQLSLTAQDMVDVRKLSIDLGNDLSLPGVSALDAAQAIAVLTKTFAALGPGAVKAAELAAKGTLQLARAAGVGAEDAGALIGSAVNVFGVAADKAVSVADEITGALTHAAGVSFQNFSDAFTQGASVFSSFITPAEGATQSLVDFNAAIAVLAKNGIVGGTAGAGLKSFFLLGRRETAAAGKAMEDLVARAGETGTLFFDASGKARTFAASVDILRKGVIGLTDSQRTNDLTTLFGSRGVTAANALIKTSAAEYAALTLTIQQQGLAAKIAAAQNTGFKGALDALQSVVETIQILFYEKVNPALGKATLFIADLANKVFFANGAWATFRQIVLGAAAGIGALIAVKGAIEVIQLLGLAAKAALSPFSLLILAAAGIGAAIQLGVGPIKSFGQVLDFAKARLSDLGDLAKTYVLPALKSFGTWVVTTAVPAVERFAGAVGNVLVSGFHTAVGFITGTAIPALKSFGSYIADKVVPIAISFGETVEKYFGIGLKKVQEFWGFIKPFIQPAIDGFKKLGSAIAGAFTGEGFSKILGGLGSAGAGIGSVFANIGKNIYGALKPLGETILNFLKEIFSGKSFGKLAGGLLDLVEAIGRFLGSHVDFVVEWAAKIGVALAAAAALIAGRFLLGFADGLRKSLPVLAGDLRDILLDAFKGAFSGDILSIAILGAAGFGVFKLLGSKIGTEITGGIKSAFSSGGAKGFLQGFFGTADQANIRSQFSGFQKEIQTTQNQLRILGSTTVVEPRNIQAANAELKNLRAGFTDTQVAGLQARDRLNGALTAIKGSIQGAAGVAKSFGTIFTLGFGQGIAGIKNSFEATMNGLRTVADEQGTTVGKYLGKGIAVGLAAAVGGGVAGFAAGKQGANPILTGLTTGLTTAAFAGPVVGVVAGGAAAIGAAMGNAAKKAKDLQDRINNLAKTISGDLQKALKDGTLNAITFRNALSGDTGFDVLTSIIENFSDKATIALHKAGIGIEDIRGALKSQDFTAINAALEDTFGSTSDIKGDPHFKEREAAFNAITEAAKAYGQAVEAARAQESLLDTGSSGGRGQNVVSQAYNRSRLGATRQGEAARDGVDPSIAGDYDKISAAVTKYGESVAAIDPKVRAATEAVTSFAGEAARLGHMPAVTFDAGAVQGTIDNLKTKVSDLNAELDLYITKIAIAFGAAGATEQATNQGVLDIQNAINALGAIDPTSTLEVDKANRQTAIDQITTDISTVVTAGITDGTIHGVDDAKAAVSPLLLSALQAIDQLQIPESAKAALRLQVAALFNDGFANAAPDIAAAAAAAAAAARTGLSQGMLAAILKAKTSGVNVVDGLTAGLADKAAGARLTAQARALGAIVEGATKTYLQIKSPSKVMYDLGVFAGKGLEMGLAASTDGLGATITNAVEDAVQQATTAAERAQKSLQATFADLFNFSISSSGVGSSVTSGITNAIQGLLSAFDSNASNVFGVADANFKANNADKDGNFGPQLTKAQLDVLGESLFSLDPNDVIGSSNITALTTALTAVQDAGKALLAQGANPQSVADSLKAYTSQIKDQAVALGLSSDGIDSLINQLGLGDESLQAFVASAQAATQAFGDAAEAAKAAAASAGAQDAATSSANYAHDYVQKLVNETSGNKDALVAAFQDMGPDMLRFLFGAIADKETPESLAAMVLTGGNYTVPHAPGGPKVDPTTGLDVDSSAFKDFISGMNLAQLVAYLTQHPELIDLLGLGDNTTIYDAAKQLDGWQPSDPAKGSKDDPTNETLPTAGTQVFNIYPPTNDPAAIALGIANHLAGAAYVP